VIPEFGQISIADLRIGTIGTRVVAAEVGTGWMLGFRCVA